MDVQDKNVLSQNRIFHIFTSENSLFPEKKNLLAFRKYIKASTVLLKTRYSKLI